MVTTVDRGRWTCAPDSDATREPVVAMRARELGRTPVVVGDQVGLVGDLSGKPDTLARIVRVEEVIMNLGVNARDAMPQGGTVKISTFPASITEEYVRDRKSVV